jgi:hypothetical protein
MCINGPPAVRKWVKKLPMMQLSVYMRWNKLTAVDHFFTEPFPHTFDILLR